jgi:glycine hydroxymethyltransferase
MRAAPPAINLIDQPLAEVDPEMAVVLANELQRQRTTLEMLAATNSSSRAILEAQSSVFLNQAVEGYVGKRYWSGCEQLDVVETMAVHRAKAVFGAEYVNVQPHSCAQANAAAYMALLENGDTILGMDLTHGGHLTHGMKSNFSGRFYDVVSYHVRRDNCLVDLEEVGRLARQCRPKLIVVGWSAYPRQLDFAGFRRIADEVGAHLLVDMAHFAGLVAAGLHPSPVPHADVVTTSMHKTLWGARGGLILCRAGFGERIDKGVFPGQQSALMANSIAAKAVALKVAQREEFVDNQQRTVRGARILAERLLQPDVTGAGIGVLTGGTDVHLVLLDLRRSELTGRLAEDRLSDIGIRANRNVVPFDPLPPRVSSGLRIGTQALASRGFQDNDFVEVADIVALALRSSFDGPVGGRLRRRVDALVRTHPLYSWLDGGSLGG